MQGREVKRYLDSLAKEKGLSLLDFSVWKKHQPLLRYTAKGTGKELLYLYSATKPLTVVCAMRLVEEGKLSLGDPVKKYLPAFANMRVKDGAPVQEEMTVKHLLTMTAGFNYDIYRPPVVELLQKGICDTLSIVNAFASSPLDFQPGERFQYSVCHDILGAVIEVASGKRFSRFMQELIFDPLGMRDTGFHLEKTRVLAPQYWSEDSRTIAPFDKGNELVVGDEYDSGGAGVISTVGDYALFADALACGGTDRNGYRLLQEQTLEKIREGNGGRLSLKNGFTCVQGEDYGYGLGVRTRIRATDWGLPVGEFGWDGAAGTYLMVDPVNEVSIVIGMHLRNWPAIFDGEHLAIVKKAYADLHREGII
ncbi:MAG: beta-lactamase family protein [Clostridia bacterium]|nr:beta-lactamase family protein [Clostridia bacterium]